MDSEDEKLLSQSQTKLLSALRSDLLAALAAFDRAQDWADLIHDLQRVNRILEKYSSFPYIPEKHLLAKRLAQCLTSFLPSGVHLKALETYHNVFSRIGPVRLARDLPLYSGGLFPLFSHCSTSLKAPLLSLYESHFLPLGPSLSPVLDGFVLALLPGIEDESSELYQRSRKLLDNLGESVGDLGVFARSVWRALLVSPPMRLPAANYLRSRLSTGETELRSEMVSDMPLVAYAMTAALEDVDALTQRSVLDLLLGELALDSSFFQRRNDAEHAAAVAVVRGVFGTLIRRDLSLTKRVHAWLLGGRDGIEGIKFCQNYTIDLVLAAIDDEINSLLTGSPSITVKQATRPIKIAASIMDREELLDSLGHHFALKILGYGRRATNLSEQQFSQEICLAISDMLQNLGSARVFAELERMLHTDEQKTKENFEILTFALSMFPIKDDIVRREHLPKLLHVAVQSMSATSTDTIMLEKAVSFCSRAIIAIGFDQNLAVDKAVVSELKGTVSTFASFFVAWLAQVVEPAPAELRRDYSDVSVNDEYTAEMKVSEVFESREEVINLAKGACSVLETASTAGMCTGETLQYCLHATAKCTFAGDARISLAGIKGFAEVAANIGVETLRANGNDDHVSGVIRRCWRQLHPSLQTATPQCAQAFLRLHKYFPEETRNVMADGILSSELSRRLRNLERFACLWRLAVEHRLQPIPADTTLFLILDALTDDDWGPKMLAKSWLSDALEVDAAAVLDAPLRLLLTPESRTVDVDHFFAGVYDAPRALYGFQALRGVLESCLATIGVAREHTYKLFSAGEVQRKNAKRGRTGIRALATTAPSPEVVQALANIFSSQNQSDHTEIDSSISAVIEGPVTLSQLLPAHNYIITIAIVCLGYLRGRVPSEFKHTHDHTTVTDHEGSIEDNSKTPQDVEFDEQAWISSGLGFKSLEEHHGGVCAAAAECLATLLRCVPIPSQMSSALSNALADPVLTLVQKRLGTSDPVVELHYLNTMSFLITADGPCYLSSIVGKDVFAKTDPSRASMNIARTQNQPQVHPQVSGGYQQIQIGAVEGLDQFVPWILSSVSSVYQDINSAYDTGSHKILGVRRQWIHFMDTVLRHVGASLPFVTEGMLLVLCERLRSQNEKALKDARTGDSEFSRIDETLVLLEALFVVTSNVLWSFEYALASGDLKDSSQSNTAQSSTSLSSIQEVAGKPGHVTVPNAQSSVLANGQRSHSLESISSFQPSGSTTQPDRGNTLVNATSTMISAINPLRMINDFVKDVFTGHGTDGTFRTLDPRRAAARFLFSVLPDLLHHGSVIWGPSADDQNLDLNQSNGTFTGDAPGTPRLSTELPRERRQAQRSAVLNIIEPIFELRSIDVIACSITLLGSGQSPPTGEPDTSFNPKMISKQCCQMLHTLDYATPDVVSQTVRTIFAKATGWDETNPDAMDGRAQLEIRQKSKSAVAELVSSSAHGLTPRSLLIVGQSAPSNHSASLPGGVSGIDTTQTNGIEMTRHDLFHWGDFFAGNSPARIETSSLQFLNMFLRTCTDADDINGVWPTLHALLKDALTLHKRKASLPALLRLLGTFVSRTPSPYPDRRIRREIMTVGASIISACSLLASGSSDISKKELELGDDVKKEISIAALQALAETVPQLIDSSFLEERQQLISSVYVSLNPSTLVLKNVASRVAAKELIANDTRRIKVATAKASSGNKSERDLDTISCKAAADVILNISKRDWGAKATRKELLSLIEDTNFFYGKQDGVLERISAIVREVMASGGSPDILKGIGTTASNSAPGIPNIFAGRDSELVLRSRAIRRIAYCVFVSDPDFYSPQLPMVLEKIRDAFRLSDSTLVIECLLCLRALLLKTGANSIAAFRATTLSELFRILSQPEENLEATIAALKFLDLTSLLSPPDYSYEQSFFFGETTKITPKDADTNGMFQPLAGRLAALWNGNISDKETIFANPLRLKAGCTVLPCQAPSDVNANFVGRYAAGLMIRNSMPCMKASKPLMELINKELENEFLAEKLTV